MQRTMNTTNAHRLTNGNIAAYNYMICSIARVFVAAHELAAGIHTIFRAMVSSYAFLLFISCDLSRQSRAQVQSRPYLLSQAMKVVSALIPLVPFLSFRTPVALLSSWRHAPAPYLPIPTLPVEREQQRHRPAARHELGPADCREARRSTRDGVEAGTTCPTRSGRGRSFDDNLSSRPSPHQQQPRSQSHHSLSYGSAYYQ